MTQRVKLAHMAGMGTYDPESGKYKMTQRVTWTPMVHTSRECRKDTKGTTRTHGTHGHAWNSGKRTKLI